MKENDKEMTKVITFERNGMNVKVNGIDCIINKQASKGENKEVANFEKIVGKEWQNNRQLSLIPEGISQLTIGLRKQTGCKKYVLTEDEQAQIAEYQSKIDAIIESAKARYVPSKKNAEDYSIEELQALIARKQKEAMELQAKLK